MTSKVTLNIPQNAKSLVLNLTNNKGVLTSVRVAITNLKQDGPTPAEEVVYDKVLYITGRSRITLEYPLQQVEYLDKSAPTALQISINSASNHTDAGYSFTYRS